MVDNQPIVLPEPGQELRQHTPPPQPLAPAPWPQTPEPCPRPRTLASHPLIGLEFLGLVTPQKPRPAVWTPREAAQAGNTSDVDVDQQLLSKSAWGDRLPDAPLPDATLPVVPLPEVCPDCSVGEKWTSPCVAEEAMVDAFGLGSGSCLIRFVCSNLFVSGIDYYMHHKVLGLLRVCSIYGFCIGFILFIVLWDIAHAAFLQLRIISKERIEFCAQLEGTWGEIFAASPIALQSWCKYIPNDPIPKYGRRWPQRQSVHLI